MRTIRKVFKKRKLIKKTCYSLLACAVLEGCMGTELPTGSERTSPLVSYEKTYHTYGDTEETKNPEQEKSITPEEMAYTVEFDIKDVPEYSGAAYAEVNGNIPYFTKEQLCKESFEYYSPMDSRGRCGTCVASIGPDIMPTEERGEIGHVKPSGWHTVKYPEVIEDLFLYNRCHLIGYQLTGENDNEKNLITGTRYLNFEGMLPFENMVADYVERTGNHVMYRITPIFEGENLLANGILMEAYSVEDNGKGICFCVYCYNVQPGVAIAYSDGESKLIEEKKEMTVETESVKYILNTNTKKFHEPSCSSVSTIKEKNYEEYAGSRQALIDDGYAACKRCNP